MAYVHAKALVASFAKVIQWLAITKLRNQQAGCKGKKTGSSNQRRLNTALMDFSATACRLPLTIKGASMLRFGPRHGFVFFILTIGLLLSACGGSSVHVTARNATLVSIGVTPANPNLPQGLTGQFTATGTYSDNSTQDLTAQVAWSSSNTGVATIDSAGLATSVAGGAPTITATLGLVSGNTTLTVTNATLSSIAVTPTNPSIANDRLRPVQPRSRPPWEVSQGVPR